MRDVVIVGAGPVGSALALALARAGRDVVALDARARGATLRGDRTLALAHGSQLVLERLRVWEELASVRDAVTPITRIDVSQAGGFGAATLLAADAGVPALGYVVSYVALQAALDAALERERVDVRFGAQAERVETTPERARVPLPGAEPVDARLAVVADGTGTAVRGVDRVRHDYGQVAVIGKLAVDRPHDGLAYERFGPGGPIALLPEADHYAFVWTLPPARAQSMLALSDEAFVEALATSFGSRLRGFRRAWGRRSFPLVLEFATPVVGERYAAVGNASQTLHPVAGQGFNVGLRDAHELARIVAATPAAEIGSGAMLARYRAARRADRWAGIAFTHGLVHLFGGDWPVVSWPRGLGLALLDTLPPLRRTFTRAMLFGA